MPAMMTAWMVEKSRTVGLAGQYTGNRASIPDESEMRYAVGEQCVVRCRGRVREDYEVASTVLVDCNPRLKKMRVKNTTRRKATGEKAEVEEYGCLNLRRQSRY
jgi:hypothetical protein